MRDEKDPDENFRPGLFHPSSLIPHSSFLIPHPLSTTAIVSRETQTSRSFSSLISMFQT